jgi:hypothetical protein
MVVGQEPKLTHRSWTQKDPDLDEDGFQNTAGYPCKGKTVTRRIRQILMLIHPKITTMFSNRVANATPFV